MSVYSALYSYIGGIAGVSALVGDRIYTNAAPASPTLPYMVIYRTSEERFDHRVGKRHVNLGDGSGHPLAGDQTIDGFVEVLSS